MKKLPVKEFLIDEDNGAWVTGIAVTKTPAIQSNFITFSKNTKQKFTANGEQRELLGIAMKAGELIYRKDEDGSEYDGFFSAETIRKIAQIFFKKGYARNFNIEHTNESAEAYAYQSFIVDSAKGVHSPKGLDAKDGDWIIGVKCENDKVFNELKNEWGFSVEGIFGIVESAFKSEEEIILNRFYEALSTLFKTA